LPDAEKNHRKEVEFSSTMNDLLPQGRNREGTLPPREREKKRSLSVEPEEFICSSPKKEKKLPFIKRRDGGKDPPPQGSLSGEY